MTVQLFALVVFACITTEGYINPPNMAEAKCIFNQNDSTCHYAVSIGVIGFLACVAFLLLDIYIPFTSNPVERKYATMADLGFSGTQVSGFFPQKRKICQMSSLSSRVLGREFSQGVEDGNQKKQPCVVQLRAG